MTTDRNIVERLNDMREGWLTMGEMCKEAAATITSLRAEAEQLKANAAEIANIIEAVEYRCMSVDGPVTPTLQEMTQQELSRIYFAAGGRPEDD